MVSTYKPWWWEAFSLVVSRRDQLTCAACCEKWRCPRAACHNDDCEDDESENGDYFTLIAVNVNSISPFLRTLRRLNMSGRMMKIDIHTKGETSGNHNNT
jgi:hypothetical protein